MATSDARNILRGGGRLVVSPTSVGGAFPHGGTELGEVRSIEFVPEVQTRQILRESIGGAVVDDIQLGERAVLVGILRSWDSDILSVLFPVSAAGGSGRIINGHAKGTVRPGELIGPARSVKLLYVANAPTRDPSLVLYRALPRMDSAARIALSIPQGFGLPFAFEATPDSTASAKIYQMARLSDITL